MTDATWKTKPVYPRGWATVPIERDHPRYQELNEWARSAAADPRERRWDDAGELWVAPTRVWR